MKYPPIILPDMDVVPPLDPITLHVGGNIINEDEEHPINLTAPEETLLKNPRLQANWTGNAVAILVRYYRFLNEPARNRDSRKAFVRRLFLGSDV